MSGKTGRYSQQFKLEALQRMETCRNVSALARELNIRRKFLYAWRAAFRAKGEDGLQARPVKAAGGVRKLEPELGKQAAATPNTLDLVQRVAHLERQLGVKQEIDFFKRTFEHVRGAMQTPTAAGDGQSTEAFKQGSRSKDRD
jgi:transposase-like protein